MSFHPLFRPQMMMESLMERCVNLMYKMVCKMHKTKNLYLPSKKRIITFPIVSFADDDDGIPRGAVRQLRIARARGTSGLRGKKYHFTH